MKRLKLLLLFLVIGNMLFSQEIKDKTKYYVKNIENFNNYSSNGWDLLDNKQLKVIAKALNINTEEAQKINMMKKILRELLSLYEAVKVLTKLKQLMK